jgi:hypothetical protein
MTRISISRKNAEAIYRYLNAETTAIWMPAFHELRAALQPRAKSSAVRKTEKKRRTKGAETKAIRAAVMERAGGACEVCGGAGPLDLHHAFGRIRVPQAKSNCVALCRRCHDELTRNYPTAAHWWGLMSMLFARLGLGEESHRALRQAHYSEAKAELSEGAR